MQPLPHLRDIMVRELITLRPDTEILRAMDILLKRRISGACVVDAQGALLGVLSKKDCMRAALHGAYHQDRGSSVSHHMSTQIEALDPELDLLSVAERFLSSKFRRFPVLENGQLVGQVSRTDVLRALMENWGSVVKPA